MSVIRIKMQIEYDGTDFSGWQLQSEARTVQGDIEAMLEKLCTGRIAITGSGRTDAGVHALGQVAHADIGLDKLDRVMTGLPAMLPDDIGVTEIEEVDSSFHARFHAISRLYRYRIEKNKHPLRNRYSHILALSRKLVTSDMQKAAKLSIGKNDWMAMAKEGSDNSDWIVNVIKADVIEDESGWTFLIRANRFLRGMVRIWAGTLVNIGSGTAPPELITELLETKVRKKAGVSLPGKGLTLMEVEYN
ncbi:MAG: tRNA pseudouridine(38-40) synthase TruA [Candidatus Aegiribacteria sp.]|nr:tRNA pseudouridine(38-40) synthase TruA [Candidatus Aegiribacteria sp.]